MSQLTVNSKLNVRVIIDEWRTILALKLIHMWRIGKQNNHRLRIGHVPASARVTLSVNQQL